MILFIAQHYNSFFGGGVITHRNLTVCEDVFGKENIKTFLLPSKTIGGIETVRSFANAYLLGLSKKKESELIHYLKTNSEIKYIFIDNSMLGRLAKSIKKEIPQLHIIVFFHNVEVAFFSTFLKSTKRYLHAIGLASIFFNEKLAIKHADSIFSLNQRDSLELLKKYGRKADLILPSSIEDKFDVKRLSVSNPIKPLSLLFVGSRFFPNEQGIEWFINNVMPFLNRAHLKIIGKGFEELKDKWSNDKIEVIGSCPDIAPYYYDADIIVAPIFTGSGMKTKTAEALMYGKTILASTESWEGYDIDKNLAGGELNTADQYVTFINGYQSASKFNINSRIFFLTYFSLPASVHIFKSYLKN